LRTTFSAALACALLLACCAADALDAPRALITQVAAGEGTTCVVQTPGWVRCVNDLGEPTFEDRTGDASKVATGIDQTCVLRITGNVDCHGFFAEGGYNGGDAVDVGLGAFHACVLTRAGDVHCWGNDAQGEAIQRSLGDVAQLAVGGWHTCLRLKTGQVTCEGDQEDQMFNYTGTDTLQVSAGQSHTCILFKDHTVRCRGWGYWSGETVVDSTGDATAIAAGDWGVTCVLHLTGNVSCNGSASDGGGSYGLGNAIGVASGWGHSCAIVGVGTAGLRATCWGSGAPAGGVGFPA